ncbi:SHOCT domain-containing protein [Arthrobacter agilis]|uniref:hypothetical protein n=1 Tax=Arthrobacter agilis TaxID=37921 RepID=UPI000B3611BB|nr:hypothetical protein [Arthrobacter agilis]OUM40606.1 hypothetical protein B8W74_14010 [Arthrobacter agilis]PPB45217.1 SHOCT domain-containing protein [Arthrobacter agilis]TPV27920.1 SHOCT domain-containing protein [Arthrobacter agilis]VDR31398.1 Uncharacterised protein [Arthrobacter agilis]
MEGDGIIGSTTQEDIIPDPSLDPGATGAFDAAFTIILVLVLAVFVFVIVSIVRNAGRARRAGHDPLTLQTDLAVRALDSEMLGPRRSTADRLAELQSLHEDGTITADELAAARGRILGGSSDR